MLGRWMGGNNDRTSCDELLLLRQMRTSVPSAACVRRLGAVPKVLDLQGRRTRGRALRRLHFDA